VPVEVWAPHAGAVDLLIPHRLATPMRSVGGGWFAAPDVLEPGTDYGFSLDGSESLPDPRSHWQPSGVFGVSRVVDHDDFPWTDGDWLGTPFAGSVIYELHVGTFSEAGTFDGAIPHLDHLVDLGVDLVELMPVNAFDGARGWGYDGVLLFAVHEAYGGPGGLKRFVDAAHARGVGVLLDVVYNHFGPSGNHLGRFGPYTTDRHRTPWGDAVNLDGPDSGPVRRFFLDNARHWLRNYHLDGLRLDAVHALVDDSDHHFLAELAEEIDALATALHRLMWVVAEYPSTEPLAVAGRESGGHGLTAEWRDEVHHAVHAAITGERDGYYADYGSLADIASAMTGPKEELSRHRFVACTQNHDQVGNRAKGERLVHLTGVADARIAIGLLLCGPFTPLLFMGEEWAASTSFPYFCDARADWLDHAVRRGRQEEFAAFGWDLSEIPDPVALSTFESARLRWAEAASGEAEHAGMLMWYRRLLSLRRERAELTDPRPSSTAVEADEERRLVIMRRGATTIIANFGEAAASLMASGSVLTASVDDVVTDGQGVVVPPHSLVVIG
jgi:maltooligosyltrehalose trehalohydrolase